MTVERVLPKSFMRQLVVLKRLEWHALSRREWAREAVDMLETVPLLQVLETKLIHDNTEGSDVEYPDVDALMEALSQDAAAHSDFLPHLRSLSLSGEIRFPLVRPTSSLSARSRGHSSAQKAFGRL